MNLLSPLLAALAVLSAAGFVAWVWFAMVQIEADLLAFEGHEGMDFEVWRFRAPRSGDRAGSSR
jgi:hypothetical protein